MLIEHPLERWAKANAVQSSLVEIAIAGRRIHLLVEGTAPVDASVDGLRRALSEDRTVTVVVLGSGGRSRIGTVLTRRALVTRELGTDVKVRWVEADRDRPIRRWAQALEIEVI